MRCQIFSLLRKKAPTGILSNEGVDPGRVFFVGNLMIDSLIRAIEQSRASSLRSELGLKAQGYAVLTLHRPSNVDDEEQLTRTLDVIAQFAQRIPVIFPAHPRTARNIEAARRTIGLRAVRTWEGGELPGPGLWMMPPASYLDFLDLIRHAAMVITDSGGVQEETTFLGVPCLTYRDSTERPVPCPWARTEWSEATLAAYLTALSSCLKTASKADSRLSALLYGTGRLLQESCISSSKPGSTIWPAPRSLCLCDGERPERVFQPDSSG